MRVRIECLIYFILNSSFSAKYMDSKLRAGNKDLSDDSLENTMDELVILFRFVHGMFSTVLYSPGYCRQGRF